jgi:tetratricopeptide (TPR) repeat protein
MTTRQKNHRLSFAAIVCILVVVSDGWAAQDWFGIKSAHFRLIGNASEEEMSSVAAGLEQLLPALPTEVAGIHRGATESIVIMLFKDEVSYEPFRARDSAAINEPGYFIAGRDLNFIAARVYPNQTQRIVNHELFHALYRSDETPLPTWANEGLADYFSTFDGGVGSSITSHIRLLRSSAWIPLAELLSADRHSRYYTDSGLKETFYAESWLLVHYLNLRNGGKIADEIFPKTVLDNATATETELHQYLASFAANEPHAMFSPGLYAVADNTINAFPITESEANTWQSDLLLHLDQLDAAERRLEIAMNSQPRFSGALTAKGILRLRQGRNAEALQWLEDAVQEDSRNPLAHFHYAEALQAGASNDVDHKRSQRLELSRTELLRTMELAPWLADAYEWLGYVTVALQDGYTEAESALLHAIERYPDRRSLRINLGEVKSAEATHLEREVRRRERESRERLAAALETLRSRAPSVVIGLEHQAATSPTFQTSAARKAAVTRRRYEGLLTMIECRDGLTLVLRSGDSFVRFHTKTPIHLEFTSKTSNAANEAACGLVRPEHDVVVTYIPGKSTLSMGEPIRIEYR